MVQGYSFVSPTTNPSVVEMHRLVQVATRKSAEVTKSVEQRKEKHINNLCALNPPEAYENWSDTIPTTRRRGRQQS